MGARSGDRELAL